MTPSKVSVNLGPVQETLLIPLLGRAIQTQKANGLIRDEKAVQIVESLDYDFSKWRKSKSLTGATLRTRMFDQDVQAFLAQYPTGTVVEIGCGLNTRFERLDNDQAHWFDLDLPDTLALRRQFFQDEPRRKMIAASVLETDWMATVAATGGPWCFVSEAVIIYLDAAQARQAITQIAEHFPSAWFLTDTTSQKMVDSQSTHDAMRHLPQASWFRWACDDPREIERWGNLRLVQSRTFFDAGAELMQQVPWQTRFFVRWTPWLIRSKVQGYRLNRFVIESAD
ncbi:MAG: class I SAM-dependent methyltransferase [Leptolyngbya sp. SIO4C1]|nr:class I SAM-dependent methyltransferase [Leptolyngbya sp. SIO4C1]